MEILFSSLATIEALFMIQNETKITKNKVIKSHGQNGI
jgi:hypothetical protein